MGQLGGIAQTIEEYRHSCRLLSGRIAQLGRMLSQHVPETGERSLHRLAERRYLLYRERGEMLGAIREMEEYLARVSAPAGRNRPHAPEEARLVTLRTR